MDVDHAIGIMVHEAVGQDLHVPGQNNQLDVPSLELLQHAGFLLELVFHRDRKKNVRDSEVFRDRLAGGVIADDRRELCPKFAGAMAKQKVVQTVVFLRRQHRGLRDLV